MLQKSSHIGYQFWTGHATAFIADAQALIERGKAYFNDNGEPFTITCGGRKLYILTTPEDVAEVYRNNATLSWDAMLNELFVGFGVRPSVIHKIWEKLPVDVLQKGRPELDPAKVQHLSSAHSTLDLYKRQLLPGPRFEKINETLTGYISSSLQWTPVSATYGSSEKRRIECISLRDFCSNILVDAITRTLFGDGIYDIEPRMTQCISDFNEDAWMLVFNYPQGKNSKLSKARNQLLKAFVAYIRGPKEIRRGQAWLIQTTIEEQMAMDINDEDRAALLLMIYWAANINPYKLAFWMLSYILFDPSLLATLRTETRPAYDPTTGTIANPSHLLTACPLLDSVYNEVLRIVNGALSARKIIAPTVIGGKTLTAPNTILIAFRQLQYNRRIFGSDPAAFDSARFLREPSLRSSASFRPFGGGVNYCPGRFLARQEMLVFVALVLQRFEVTLAASRPGQVFPELDTSTPALGINSAKAGMDLFIDLEETA
ncbi:MAG: hypothetical protein Q9157_002321 [Trypethelium eluteriae]